VTLIQREATLRGQLPPIDGVVNHAWTWPVQPHVDPTKEATAERTLLENGTISWEDAIAAHGQDPDVLIEKLKRDAERRKEIILPKFPQEPAAATPEPEIEEENANADE
jgi:capsid protein